jgi:hypothetical protein
MEIKSVNLNLPEWAWVDGGEHETGGDPLKGRNVIMHVRSATVLEILEQDMCIIKDGVRQIPFEYVDVFGIAEQMVCVLHYSATLEDWDDKIETIMQKGIEWYKTYCAWEDRNIVVGDSAELN